MLLSILLLFLSSFPYNTRAETEEEDDDDDDDDGGNNNISGADHNPHENFTPSDAVLIDRVRTCFRLRSQRRREERETKPFLQHNEGDPVVVFTRAIDEVDMSHINVLSECVRKEVPHHAEDRHFGLEQTAYGGGNNVTYIGGYFQRILPELEQHIIGVASIAAEQAGWRPHPSQLGIRCIERLVYGPGGVLMMHKDSDSIYTMVFMLSHPSRFTGGEFTIDTNGERKKYLHVNPEHGGGIFFDSNVDHAVRPIKTGERIVLAVEFWPYEDTDIADLRPETIHYEGMEKIPSLMAVLPYENGGKAGGFQHSEKTIDGDEIPSMVTNPLTGETRKLSAREKRLELKKLNRERRRQLMAKSAERYRKEAEKKEAWRRAEEASHLARRYWIVAYFMVHIKPYFVITPERIDSLKWAARMTYQTFIWGPHYWSTDMRRGVGIGLLIGALYIVLHVNFVQDFLYMLVRGRFRSPQKKKKAEQYYEEALFYNSHNSRR